MHERLCVLIVEDDSQLAIGVSRRLRAAGYATHLADDGDTGLAAAQAKQPDVILLDVMMPRLDGLTALRRLRDDARTRDVPVIMLSASLGDQRAALDAGASYFPRKPYSHDHLFAAVARVVGGKSNSVGNCITELSTS